MKARGAVVIVCVSLFLFARAALAADPAAEEAKALFKKAETHFSLGEHQKALDLYREAYKIKALPGFLFNIAQCHRYLGQYERALFFYQRFLALTPDTPLRSTVEGLIVECRDALAKEEQARAASRPASAEAVPTSTPASAPTGPSGETPPPPKRSYAGVWTALAVGGALVVGGAVCGGIALSKNREYKDAATSIPTRQELKDSGYPLAITSAVLLGVGGGTVVGTLIYYLVARRQHPAERSVAAVPLAGGGALVYSGSF